MIEFTTGDLFTSSCEALVNTVNTQGVMGAGIALEFKRRFPRMFVDYKRACQNGTLKPGTVMSVRIDGVWVVNFATKDHWRDDSCLEWVEQGLGNLRHWIRSTQPGSIAIPPLGCGLGGLNWKDVRPMIERHLGDLEIRILVYEPQRK